MPADDLLQKIKSNCQALRDAKLRIKDIEESLSEAKSTALELQRSVLPDLMAQAGVPKLTIEAEGNSPPYEIKVRPFARANVASNWPEEKRQAAFDWLDANGYGDLIKTVITVELDKDDRSGALELIGKLRSLGYEPAVAQATHHATMGKWLRECVTRGIVIPLDIVGGEVGMEATIKEVE